MIVTGAARGNGRAIAEGFVRYGSNVYFVDILDEVDKVVSSLGSKKAHSVVCDITDITSLQRLINKVIEESSQIDVLVNNAGVSIQNEDPYDEEVWKRTLEVNLNAVFRLSKTVAKVMIEQNRGGVIINITSLAAEFAFPDNPSYVASKGGLRLLGKAMARDLSKFNIRVNNVSPGYMITPMTYKSYSNPVLKEERNKRIMLRRWGEPEDLVGPCIFLASDASAYITGIDLPVDGGWHAKGL